MDPYLEGYLWPDVHHRLATQISDQLMPLLRPHYVARIEVQIFTDETSMEIEVRLASVEIRDTAQNQLITSIEILSPINKREPGLTKYREKRRRLHEAGVHLLEIDLLRRGQRPFAHPRIPSSAYLVALTRAQASFADIWAINLSNPLPVVSVPLHPPDEDVVLDLALAFTTIYDRAAYDLSLNYNETPPPPPLTDEEQTWLKRLLESRPL
jgi:hypothetical protein